MKKQAILKLITESKLLLSTATPQQKLRLLQLIKEGLKQHKYVVSNKVHESKNTLDYLEEK